MHEEDDRQALQKHGQKEKTRSIDSDVSMRIFLKLVTERYR